MPRYYKSHNRGYDLDEELPFIEVEGERYLVGSAGSVVVVCEVCGEEHFRESLGRESCFQEGHGLMVPVKLCERSKYHSLYVSRGDRIVSVEERRIERLKSENERLWDWQFGNKKEADFPLGYAKEDE